MNESNTDFQWRMVYPWLKWDSSIDPNSILFRIERHMFASLNDIPEYARVHAPEPSYGQYNFFELLNLVVI